MLNQTETAFREILGGMQAASEDRYWRRLQTTGLASNIGEGVCAMETSMHLVSFTQKARTDVTSILYGKEVQISSLSDLEQKALSIASSGKWVKSSAEREALIDIYDKLFESIEAQMH